MAATLREIVLLWMEKKLLSVPPAPPQAEVMKPTMCQCGHGRSFHAKGQGVCHVGYPPTDKWPNGSSCACQWYVFDPDGDDEEDEPEPITPTADDFRKGE